MIKNHVYSLSVVAIVALVAIVVMIIQSIYNPVYPNFDKTLAGQAYSDGNVPDQTGPFSGHVQEIHLDKRQIYLISFNVLPEDTRISNVFKEHLGDIIFQSADRSQTYSGEENIDFKQPYLIYPKSTPLTIEITGKKVVADYVFRLNKGTNYLAYPLDVEVSTDEFFEEFKEKILLVKDSHGTTYIPGYNLDTLKVIKPGDGYYVEMLSEAEIDFGDYLPDCGDQSGIICSKNKICEGDIVEASDTEECCMGTCALPKLEDTITVYVSSMPSNIICANQMDGPHKAELTLTGTSKTDPRFTVEAKVSYESQNRFHSDTIKNLNGEWIIDDIEYSPNNFDSPILIATEIDYPGLSECLAVQTQGEEYMMDWHISGMATPSVKPVLLPRLMSKPFAGNKKILVIKGRHTPEYDPDAYPYLNNAEYYQNLFDYFSLAMKRMSDNQLNLNYEFKEAFYEIPFENPSEVDCLGDNQCKTELTRNLLTDLGITEDNYMDDDYDMIFITFYYSMIQQFKRNAYMSGSVVYREGCPQCEWVSFNPDVSQNLPNFIHELGHTFFSHPVMRHSIPDGSPDKVTDIHLGLDGTKGFYDPEKPTWYAHPYAMGQGGLRFNLLHQAALGWLKGSQVTTITESGVYDVYSDNPDMTSDPAKPLILQILVHYQGKPVYVYITLPNIEFTEPFKGTSPMPWEYTEYSSIESNLADHLRKGIQLWSVPLRSDYHTHGHTAHLYSYNNDQEYYLDFWDSAILPGKEVHLQWEGTDLILRNIERNGNHAKVEVIYDPVPLICSDQSGVICASNEICDGETVEAGDTAECCMGTCKEAHKTLFILAEFIGQPIVSMADTEKMVSMFEDYMKENSYGKYLIDSEILGPYQIDVDICELKNNRQEIVRLALAAADQEYHIDDDVNVVVIHNQGNDCLIHGGEAYSYKTYNIPRPVNINPIRVNPGAFKSYIEIAVHEFGHALTLPDQGIGHPSGIYCPLEGRNDVLLSNSCISGLGSNFEFGPMGKGGLLQLPLPHYRACVKLRKGFLTEEDFIVSDQGTHTIIPIESQSAGKKLIIIPVPQIFNTVSTNYGYDFNDIGNITLEFREPDKILTHVLYVIEHDPGGWGCNRVLAEYDRLWANPASLEVGKTYYINNNGVDEISITVNEIVNNDHASITVNRLV